MRLGYLAATALGLALLEPGCSAQPGDVASGGHEGAPSGTPGSEAPGTVGINLTLPTGQAIDVLNWTISGPGGAATVVRSGEVSSQSLGVSFLVGGIPAASGYRIALSGTATDGSVQCTGAARFDVLPRTTTPVFVELACSVATAGAHVTLINGTGFNCAATNGIAASPSETTVGHTVALTGNAAGPDPASLTYAWSAPTGTFSQPTSAGTNFECTDVGPVTVTLTVADGPVPAGHSCSTATSTATAVITCDSPDAGAPDGGPPQRVPATPPWGLAALAAAVIAVGSRTARRRHRGHT